MLCNSDPNWTGKKFLGYNLANTWDLIKQKEGYHFIVPSTRRLICSAIVRQMRSHGITDYSILLEMQLPNFEWMHSGDRLKDIFRQSLNELMDLCITDDSWVWPVENLMWHFVRGLAWWNRIYEWFDDDEPTTGAASMLEIGPGIGLLSRLAKIMRKDIKIDWLGLDNNLPRYSNGVADKVFVADIETDDFSAGEYDIIIMTEVIEHFRYNPVPTLMKIRGHLKRDGRFYLSSPPFGQQAAYPSWKDMPAAGTALPYDYHGHTYEYSHNELHEIIADAGLEIVKEGFSSGGNSNFVLRPK